MKYMVMMFGDQASMMEERSVEWVREMIGFMTGVIEDLQKRGELVSAEGLADPTQARVVDWVDGAIAVTDGPFAEAKESLAGFWILDVESEDRIIEFASQIVTFTERKVEVRRVADAPPEV